MTGWRPTGPVIARLLRNTRPVTVCRRNVIRRSGDEEVSRPSWRRPPRTADGSADDPGGAGDDSLDGDPDHGVRATRRNTAAGSVRRDPCAFRSSIERGA